MPSANFGTAINCIDGRVQAPVADWLRVYCNVTFVDVQSIPGPDKALLSASDERLLFIREGVKISVAAHGSQVVAVVGHHDCAANSTTRDEHQRMIKEAVAVVQSWNLGVRIVGLWVNDWWQVEVVKDCAGS